MECLRFKQSFYPMYVHVNGVYHIQPTLAGYKHCIKSTSGEHIYRRNYQNYSLKTGFWKCGAESLLCSQQIRARATFQIHCSLFFVFQALLSITLQIHMFRLLFQVSTFFRFEMRWILFHLPTQRLNWNSENQINSPTKSKRVRNDQISRERQPPRNNVCFSFHSWRCMIYDSALLFN